MQTFPNLPIRTARLELRPLREADVASLFEIHADPEVMRYWASPVWTSDERGHAMVADDLLATNSLRLGIEVAATGKLIGTCSLWNMNTQSRRAEIGYAIGSRHWGHGYMYEALFAFLGYGFTEMDLNRVEADTDPRNDRSIRLLERLGFSREGLFRERCIVEGEISDSAMYGLLKREWKRERGS